MTDDLSCPACATLHAAGAQICVSCGQPLPPSLASGERPTETMPAVPLSAAQPPPAAELPPAPRQATRQHDRRPGRLGYFAAGAGIALLAGALLLVAIEIGDLLGGGSGEPPAANNATPAGGTLTPGMDDDDENGTATACERQTISAPEPGAWRTATRRGDIQLTGSGGSTSLAIRLYRAGSADEAARVEAEVLPADEVESRVGIRPPGDGEEALLISFSPEVRAPGRAFELGSVGVVTGAVLGDHDGALVAVVGLSGDGCFQLSAGGWDEGRSDRSAELVIQIER